MRKSTLQIFAVIGFICTIAPWPDYVLKAMPQDHPPSANETDLQTGLVAYYPFSGNAMDGSGNGNHLILNGATLTSDRHGNQNKAYKFNGRRNSFQFPGNQIKNSAATLAFWVKSMKKSGTVLFLNAVPGKLIFTVRKVNHKFELEVKINNRKLFIKDKKLYTNLKAYNFIAIMFHSDQLKFYVNNELAGSLNIDKKLLKNFPFNLKREPYFASKSALDDIRLYSRLLNEEELETLFSEATNTAEFDINVYIKASVDSAEIFRKISSDGGSDIIDAGVCWNTTGNPDTSENKTSAKEYAGVLKSNMKNLLPNTRYYFKNYAVNGAGISYSEERELITLPDLDYGTVTDADGNQYRTVTIGTQTWMAENLNTTRYADGTPIADGTDNPSDSGKHYYIFLGDTLHRKVFGLLYSWEAATNASEGEAHLQGIQGACPDGWHIPSFAEKEALLNYLGGSANAGAKLREPGEMHWDYFTDGTNETGFTALGSGVKALEEGMYGVYVDYRTVTYYWTSESYFNNSPDYPAYFSPVLRVDGSDSHYWQPPVNFGAPVRCIMNHNNSYIAIPEITTGPVTEITSATASVEGNVESDGGQFRTVRGICWSTGLQPDTTGFKTKEFNDKVTFTDTIKGLKPNTKYYVRAYAVTDAGVGYGNEVSFTTKASQVNSSGTSKNMQLPEIGTGETLMFGFYPNPASSVIHFNNLTENVEVTIYDSQGKVLIEKNVSDNMLDISSLPKGSYFIKLSDNETTVIKKLIRH